MPLTHAGITPTLVVDTWSLQSNTPVSGGQWRVNASGHMVSTATNPGICATLVSFWLGKRFEGHMITALSEFPGSFTLSIMQSSYMMAPMDDNEDYQRILDGCGMNLLTSTTKRRKWYMWKKTRLNQMMTAAVGWPGIYYLSIRGNGGHALGVATSGTPQFFDPNEGILNFTSASDMRKWALSYIPRDYPDLLEEASLFAVG